MRQNISEDNELLYKMKKDFWDVYRWTQENGIGVNGCLSYETYIRYGNYKEYLTDYSKDGVINFYSLAKLASVPLQIDVYIEDIICVSNRINKEILSPKEYDINGKYTSREIIEIFGTWDGALNRSLGIKKNVISKNDSCTKRRNVSARMRYKVLVRDGFRCVLCGASAGEANTKLHVDHIIPISKGGTNSINNLRTLCAACNLGKGNLIIE